ncbi:hypothetical protein BN7_2727 [Wickerhamomyces ciferrii]|uniref:F-box domain-containing protein n=1 Tax=Wickerhamomyces ciferrii (strain ATCC 14091 / BCRC 22168 / CBS 111 / JCM 3599 / NBRC 0793 / NRRL Y-1031 F-60-10) TaxID=1206466 RepID=K0KDI5_WICCF|nr:uncharacterized protein BN7_2727 [Wickerhamomyces ciferrii]CCH43180.1 hypothetical protein BN7_2727 [Wickerhamomyces ciferrii]
MTIPKKRKLSSSYNNNSTLFLNIPYEIIIKILPLITKSDLINLGLSCSKFHDFLKPYIYQSITLSWKDLILLEQGKLGIQRINKFVEVLNINEYDIKKEWNFNYNSLTEVFGNLRKLKMNISNSSNFLKYLNKDVMGLKELELKSMSFESNLFNINHLIKFKDLKRLKLTGFVIDFDDKDTKIQYLELQDCFWNYPFNLEFFTGVRELILNYSNQFILSERFRFFIMNPVLPKLESLYIQNHNPQLKLHITESNLIKILQKNNKIIKIQLFGNIETSINPQTCSNIKFLRS